MKMCVNFLLIYDPDMAQEKSTTKRLILVFRLNKNTLHFYNRGKIKHKLGFFFPLVLNA